MSIINEVLNLEEFKERPPVLLDIGASGRLNSEWKKIANHSVCVAFDADDRDIDYLEKKKSNFRTLHVINKIVADKDGRDKFYLTKSPYCSSSLSPNSDELRDWSFSGKFDVEKIIETETVSLPTVLNELSIDYVDWFKSDSQGTDLRLFRNLTPSKISNVIIAEFEPGIMDSYIGEDKMHAIMSFMEDYPFWLSDLVIKGPHRITEQHLTDNLNKLPQKLLRILAFSRGSAFWGEMTYVNTFKRNEMLNRRNLACGWVFCTIRGNHAFALELAIRAISLLNDPLFEKLRRHSIRSLKRGFVKIPLHLSVRFCQKYFRV